MSRAEHRRKPALDRRTILKAAVFGGALTATGIAALRLADAAETGPTPPQAAFSHPGLLHDAADFDRIRARLDAGDEPWTSGWARLTANGRSQSTWNPRPLETVVRGGTGANVNQMCIDVAAAYQNALRWRIGGDEAHAEAASRILNAWSSTLKALHGNADRFLAAGIQGYQFANAAELMRGYDGFDADRFASMLVDVFYPLNDDFLTNHNGACISNYWANWDLCTMNSILAIGVFTDDRSKVDRAVEYFKSGPGNGSIGNAVPVVHENGLGQWQEAGRDQGHTSVGVGWTAVFCETAWKQGHDLYGHDDNRFAKGAEYVAKYNLGHDVPFTTYEWRNGTTCKWNAQTAVSAAGRGATEPFWAMVHNHYVGRRGLDLPYVTQYRDRAHVEGGGGDYGGSKYDHLGFTTLTHTGSGGPGGSVVPDGTYVLVSDHTGLALDNDEATGDRAVVVQRPADGAASQKWTVAGAGDGHVTIVSVHSGKALDNRSTTAERAKVIQWTAHGGPQQRWRVTDAGDGCVELVNEHSGKALDSTSHKTDGEPVIQFTVNGKATQRWRLTAA